VDVRPDGVDAMIAYEVYKKMSRIMMYNRKCIVVVDDGDVAKSKM
jgi:hypothetical protein